LVLEWWTGGQVGEKFVKTVLTVGCKLICSPSIVKDKHKQNIKSDRKIYEEPFCKDRRSEEGEDI
jgi:hypothetical protein